MNGLSRKGASLDVLRPYWPLRPGKQIAFHSSLSSKETERYREERKVARNYFKLTVTIKVFTTASCHMISSGVNITPWSYPRANYTDRATAAFMRS
jgi:hypothetical protein